MNRRKYDVVVIGSGPGGEGAAMKVAKSGRSVAVVEAFKDVGGGCTHWGTIPSKALRQAVSHLVNARANPLFRDSLRALAAEWPKLLRSAESVIGEQVRLRRGFYERNGVDLIEGKARFAGPGELLVGVPGGAQLTLESDYFIIATGSRPYRPPEVDFDHPRILDSDKVLSLKETPASVAVYGAGVVGCEYASIFRSLGVKTTLINTREKLLTFLDDEIVDALAYHLRDGGVILYHNEEADRVETKADGVVLHLKSGKRITVDYLLWANGRTGNTEGLGLETLGIKPDERGNLTVDVQQSTGVKGIYAVGDVVGFPALASAAYDQGRLAATHIVEGRCDERLAKDIPTGIYTIPEISSIGKTERELTQARVPYEVGHAQFRSLARAQIMGVRTGMLKLLFHRDTLEVLGVHCFGSQASEIVHIGQAVMAAPKPGNTLDYFMTTTFNYPTMAEAYRVAALNGLNRLKGIAPKH